jgi:hypothetical protein
MTERCPNSSSLNEEERGLEKIPSILKRERQFSTASTDSSSGSSSCDLSESFDGTSQKGVRFESIKVREYNMILGDNPSCCYGPPVTMEWQYDETGELSIDEYEECRPPRRKTYQMALGSRRRTNYLLESGDYTPDEIQKVEKDIRKIQRQRGRTKMMLPFSKVQEVAEKIKRRGGRNSKR